jgi:hypothetical protein
LIDKLVLLDGGRRGRLRSQYDPILDSFHGLYGEGVFVQTSLSPYDETSNDRE